MLEDGIHYRVRAPMWIVHLQEGGVVFNSTIFKYAYCTITPTDDYSMSVHFTDYEKYEALLDGGLAAPRREHGLDQGRD